MIARAKLESWHLESWNNQVKLEKNIKKEWYRQTCIKQPLLGPLKSDCLIKHLYKTTTKQMHSSLAGF